MIEPNQLKDEVRRVTGAIRNLFEIEGDLEEEDVEALHNALVECIETVNARLEKCDELLRKGLRGEAIQECEVKPKLLDLVLDLDMDEWDAWIDYVRQFGIPPQPALLVDIAAALNEAYSQSQTLDDVLRLHRLHALARSPLKTRLSILRTIAKKDSGNPVWEADVKNYEIARLREIERELRQYSAARDTAAVGQLNSELSSPHWMVVPAQKLTQSVAETYQRLQVETATEKLAELAIEINNAFSDFNVRRGMAAQTQWDRYDEIAKLSDDDPLVIQVEPAFEWLAQEAEDEQRALDFKRAVATLEQALDNESIKQPELRRLYGAVERFDEPIPERLSRRYSERMLTLELANRRRGRLVLALSALSVLVLGGLAAFITLHQIHQGKLASAVASLSRLIEDKQIDESLAYLEKLDADQPGVANAPKIHQLRAELDSLIAAEKSRRLRFQQMLAQIEEVGLQEPTWEDIVLAEADLKEAQTIAEHEHELVALKELERDVRREKGALQDAINAKFQEQVQQIVNRLKDSNSMDVAELRRLRSDAELLNRPSLVSMSVHQASNLDAIIKQLQDREKSIGLRANEDAALNLVKSSVGDRAKYAQALQAYAKLVPQGTQSDDFRNVAEYELDALVKILGWNVHAEAWNRLSFNTPEAFSKQGLDVIDRLAQYPDYPGVSNAVALEKYLQSVRARYTRSPDLLTQLSGIFKSTIFKLKSLQKTDGTVYYFLEEPTQRGPSMLRVKRLVTKDNLARTAGEEPIPLAKIAVRKGNDPYGPAPHAELASQVRPVLSPAKGPFEKQICEVLYRVQSRTDMNPVLQCKILREVLEMASPGSTVLESELSAARAILSGSDYLDKTDWLDFENPDVIRNTAAAQRFLTHLSNQNFGKIYVERVQPKVAALYRSKVDLPTIQWCGCLFKKADDQWEIVRVPGRLADGELRTMQFDDQTATKFSVVGKVLSDKISFKNLQGDTIREGRPVYLFIGGSDEVTP